MPDAYFITDHALEQWLEAMKQNDKFKIEAPQDAVKKNSHGTVGAVAVDKKEIQQQLHLPAVQKGTKRADW